METSTLKTLVTKLITNTSTGNIKWKSSSNDDQFMVSFPKSSITIDRTIKSGESIYDLLVFNENGAVIAGLRHNSSAPNTYGAEDLDNPELELLYDFVYKQFYQIDETFKDIFDALE